MSKINRFNLKEQIQKYSTTTLFDLIESEFKRRSHDRSKNKKEIIDTLDNQLEDIQAVWKLPDDDEWLASVRDEFIKIKVLVKSL